MAWRQQAESMVIDPWLDDQEMLPWSDVDGRDFTKSVGCATALDFGLPSWKIRWWKEC